ncbi:MAG: hypothetical protein AB1592_00380 [Pseudomonadota bacterium]
MPRQPELVATPQVAQDPLAERLDELAARAHITPEQRPAWSAFVGTLIRLEAATLSFEARRADASDMEQERAFHALQLGAALSEIDQSLAPDQMGTVRRALDSLVPGLICRGLASP